MKIEVTMPRMRPEMTSGVLCAWLKNEGERVAKGEALFEVETQKVVSQVEAEADGVLVRQLAEEGDEVAVDAAVAVLEKNAGENVAGTDAYRAYRAEYDEICVPEYLKSTKTEQLDDGFCVVGRLYVREYEIEENCWMRTQAGEYELRSADGQTLYRWRCVDRSSHCQLIHHANGRRYLIFHIDMYGYSVLELESGRVLHYVPSLSFQSNDEPGWETLLWNSVHYRASDSLLVVDSVYWAAPETVFLLDFSDPMREHPVEEWRDLHDALDPNYERWLHMNFERWDEDGGLWLTAVNTSEEDDEEEPLHVPAEQIRALMQ